VAGLNIPPRLQKVVILDFMFLIFSTFDKL